MGLLEQEIHELRRLKEQFKKGEKTDSEVKTLLQIYSEVDKRVKSMIAAHALDFKLQHALSKSHLIGDGQFIDQKLLESTTGSLKIVPEEKQESPCIGCDREGEDKNEPECINCEKREGYLKRAIVG